MQIGHLSIYGDSSLALESAGTKRPRSRARIISTLLWHRGHSFVTTLDRLIGRGATSLIGSSSHRGCLGQTIRVKADDHAAGLDFQIGIRQALPTDPDETAGRLRIQVNP